MKRIFLVCLLIVALCVCGCELSTEDEEDSDYDDMVSTYELLSVIELWNAMDNGDDYNGTYILVQGVLFDVDEDDCEVTLMDSNTTKTVECEFDSDIDLSELENVLDNNSGDDEDTVTIAGICRYYTNSSSYPYFTSCDYFYVNDDE